MLTAANARLLRPLPVSAPHPGTLTNGKKFDSSRDRGKPFRFRIGQGAVIRGWDEGVAQVRRRGPARRRRGAFLAHAAHRVFLCPQMSVGQRATLTCSPEYAYGAKGHPGVIPPNATLIFDVELLGLEA